MLNRLKTWLWGTPKPQAPKAPGQTEPKPREEHTAFNEQEATWRASIPGPVLRERRKQAGADLDAQAERTVRQAQADSLERQLEGLTAGIEELQARLREARETLARMRKH